MQYSDLNIYVKKKRQNLSKSLNKFALECELEPAALSKFENNKSDMLLNNFFKLIKGFKQTPGEFFSEFENYHE